MIKSKLISKATFYNKSGNKDIASFTEVASMNQTHSNVVLEIERSGVYDADALITTKKNLLLVVSTADCMPVVISDNKRIGIIHAGWKGVENKIFYNAIKDFDKNKLKVSIGPHAKACCYEIQDDLSQKFQDYTIEREEKKFLNEFIKIKKGAHYANLSGDIILFCKKNNIELEIANECTIGDKMFHSYRRDKTSLRQESTVWM